MRTIVKNFSLILLITVLLTGFAMGATTINFDTSGNWIQDGTIALSSYGNHAYSESGVTVQGTNVLRNTTTAQDGFAGALGTYSMRIRNATGAKATITVSTGGISTFSIQVRRWDNSPMPDYTVKYSIDGGSNWTSLTNINGDLLTTSDWFTYNGTINNGNDNIIIDIANTGTTERIMIDDFTWSAYVPPTGVDDPTDFSAVENGTNQIDLSWTLNGNSNNVMVVYDTDNTFSAPEDGVSYSVSESACGGTVIYNSNGTSFNHTSLSDGTTYYYKAWSVDGADAYSTGVIANATTLKAEPSNHVTSFAASTVAYTSLTLTWTDASTGVLPDYYLIKGSSVGYGDIAAPSDGTAESDDALVKNVSQGTQTATFTGLSDNTTYYFQIWPYTNSGMDIDYKTDGSVPELTQATDQIPTLPFTENFDYTAGENLTDHGWTAHSAAGTNPIQVVTPGLEFTDYASSGIGNAADVGNTGEDINHVFEEVTSGSIYASFIIKTGASNSEGYFLHLGQQVIGSTYFSRVWINATGDSVGIGASAPSPTDYVPITAGTPTLLVVKYTIATGVSDLYVCNTLPSSEPGTPDASYTESSSYNVGSIALRQFSSTQDIIVDGIRVSTSWNDSPLPITLASFTATAKNGAVELAWGTATETNNANFVIYRNNEAIASVAGAGTSSEPHSYSYVDDAVVPGVTYTYVLADVDYANVETKYEDKAVSVTVANDIVEADFVIGDAYPNPFNPTAIIPVELTRDAVLKASLYDLTGREVQSLANGNYAAGSYDLHIDGANLTTGLYLVRVLVNDILNVQKIALIK